MRIVSKAINSKCNYQLIKHAIMCLWAISITASAAGVNNIKLPELGVPSQATLSPSQEKRLGREFMQAVRYQTMIFADLASQYYLQHLGDQLVSHAEHKNKFNFFLVDDPSINAFAGPGGYVGMNTGLVTTTNNEAELAAVMAHEITHVTQRHIARGLENANQSTWPTVGAIAAALLLGGRLDAAVTSGAILTAAAGKVQHAINYTRRFEREADRIGMRVLFETGFSPDAMPSFFARMQNRTLDYSDSRLKLLRTHPVTEDRIADSQNRAHHYSKRPLQINSQYPLIKARIKVITAPNIQDIISKFSKQYQQDPNNQAVRYGYALSLARNHQYAQAQPMLEKLAEENPKLPLYQLSIAETMWSSHPDQAISMLKHAYNQFPQHHAIMLRYSQYLIDNRQAELARKVLLKGQDAMQGKPIFHALLARAQGNSNHLIEAYQSRAHQFMLMNYPRRALTQLHQAIKLAKNKPHIIRAIKEKMHAIQQEIAMTET